jgi:hypothetical protein
MKKSKIKKKPAKPSVSNLEFVELGKVVELTGMKGRQYRDGRKDSERQ